MRSSGKWLIAVIAAASAMSVCFVLLCGGSSPVVSDADLTEGSHLYMINTDGSGFVQLDDITDDSLHFSVFYWSEDGSKDAFYRKEPLFSTEEIYVADMDSSDFRLIASGHDIGCYFSWDFSKAACFDGRKEELYIISVGSGSKSMIPGYRDSGSCYWSPDSSRMAYVATDGIYIIDAESNTQARIADFDGEENRASLRWSPDSAKLYYLEGDEAEGYDLYVISADGTGRQMIAGDVSRRYQISPDGSRIFYWTEDSIYMMNADGSDKTELFDTADISSFTWSPDGSKIAYLVRMEDGDGCDLYVMDADGSSQIRLTGYDEYGVTYFEWGPDSERIYYLRQCYVTMEGESDIMKSDIYVTSIDRKYFANLTNYWDDGKYFVNWFFLSPDGQKIAYPFCDREQYVLGGDAARYYTKRGMAVVNTDGTGIKKLVECGLSYDSFAVWSPDGNRLLFVANKQSEEEED